ncbi:recombination exonuclease [Bacillus phage vB_BmeM-Goe8]|uniref:Recombination exonuclease n=1 Tax=Bacillus phage vB_BmeM-Goe8 TaxID=2593638 RepID=A0A516KMR9_9CAUD|nr:recombination exonuclease [Bacillus phage vB_BmeM-Goe8]QDP42884.1 recombination exonuclease [Bacillus phage vB_BmeM-Goe8]
MSKLVVFSDFHAHIFEDFAKPDPEYVNDRFRAQIATLYQVFDIARQQGARVLFTGDLFHKRAKIDDIVFNTVYDVFAENDDVPVYMVRGNHDARTNATVTEHWLKTFRHLKHVTVIDTPEEVYVPDEDGDYFIYGIPYSDDTEYLKKKIVEFKEHCESRDIPGVLAAHIGVDGSETGRYSHRLEGAFKVGDLFPDVFTYVALGHYHKRQFLAGLLNTFYTGNTIQTSFSDEGQDKGVMLIDFEKGGQPEFIPILNKKFITLTEVNKDTQQLVDNNYVRFVVSKDVAQEIEVFKEESDNIRVEVQKEYKTDTRIAIDMDSSEKQIVEAYANEYYPDSTSIALDILQEALAAS